MFAMDELGSGAARTARFLEATKSNPRTVLLADFVLMILTSAVCLAEARLGQMGRALNGRELEPSINESHGVCHG